MIATGKSQKALDAEAAGSRVADSLSGRPLALSCLSGRAPLNPTAQALHECPRAPPNPSPSRHLGARDRDQNFTERLPAGTAADEMQPGHGQTGTWTRSEDGGWGMGPRWKGNEGQDGWRARTGRQRRGGDCGDPEQSLASTGDSVSQTSHVDHAPMRQAEPGRGPTRGGQSFRAPALGREKERSD